MLGIANNVHSNSRMSQTIFIIDKMITIHRGNYIKKKKNERNFDWPSIDTINVKRMWNEWQGLNYKYKIKLSVLSFKGRYYYNI